MFQYPHTPSQGETTFQSPNNPVDCVLKPAAFAARVEVPHGSEGLISKRMGFSFSQVKNERKPFGV
jgi:hypothetical protein